MDADHFTTIDVRDRDAMAARVEHVRRAVARAEDVAHLAGGNCPVADEAMADARLRLAVYVTLFHEFHGAEEGAVAA